MNDALVTGIFTLLGVLAGSVLQPAVDAIRGLFRRKAERKEVLNDILFTLLETRCRIRSVFPTTLDRLLRIFIDEYAKRLKGLGEKLSPSERKSIEEASGPALVDALSRPALAVVEQMTRRFDEAVARLSRTDPVLAYGMAGRTAFGELVGAVQEYRESFLRRVPEILLDPEAVRALEVSAGVSDSANIEFFLAGLDDAIAEIAAKVGAKRQLESRTTGEPTDAELRKVIRPIVNRIVASVVANRDTDGSRPEAATAVGLKPKPKS